MTTGVAFATPKCWSPVRAAGFVWSAWRGLTARHFQYAVLAGIALGSIDGMSGVLTLRGLPLDAFILTGFLPFLVLAVLLLLCLAVAASVSTKRVPRWLPFVVAAIAAAVAAAAFDLAATYFGYQVRGFPFPTAFLAYTVRETVQKPLPIAILVALGYMYGLDAWKRANALRDVQLERIRLSRNAYESRLQALQARVEPQFLFDTLADIERIYEWDPPVAERALDDLIVYLRAALPPLHDPSSTVATELALVRAWLGIMRIRRAGNLTFSIVSTEAAAEARMPPMVLLPLVAHALEFAAGELPGPPTIDLTATVADARMRIVVAASGVAFAADSRATALVRERLHALYAAYTTLALRGKDDGTHEVQLEIPHEIAERRHR